MGVGEISVASVFEIQTSSCLCLRGPPPDGGALDFADRCGGFKKFDVILMTGQGVLWSPNEFGTTVRGF